MHSASEQAAGWLSELCRRHPNVPKAVVKEYLCELEEARQFPPVFFGLTLDVGSAAELEAPQWLRVRCHCGRCAFQVCAAGAEPEVVRCHCPACRRWCCSAFAALLRVPAPNGQEVPRSAASAAAALASAWGLGDEVAGVAGECSSMGAVARLACSTCWSKLAVVHLHGAKCPAAFVALGVVEDDSVPAAVAEKWRRDYQDRALCQGSVWWSARPSPRETLPLLRSRLVRGGCACGACEFEAALLPGEAQHCYCNLCRRLSGSAFMTWMPASNERFRWLRQESLKLVRTTRHGQWHFCTKCAGCLTSVYDDQPECTWPAAGALYDEYLQESQWYRVMHICCSMMQPWLLLPDDGLPRLRYAG